MEDAIWQLPVVAAFSWFILHMTKLTNEREKEVRQEFLEEIRSDRQSHKEWSSKLDKRLLSLEEAIKALTQAVKAQIDAVRKLSMSKTPSEEN